MSVGPKIIPCLWYEQSCEEAVAFYVDLFNGAPHSRGNSRIVSIKRYEAGTNVPGADELQGKILTAIFELDGQRFMALDGGPMFHFTEAISLDIECEDQAEVDYFWERLSAVPKAEACGWCKDPFGVSWQIVPVRLGELLEDSDEKKSLAALHAMLEMKKLVIADLERAFEEA